MHGVQSIRSSGSAWMSFSNVGTMPIFVNIVYRCSVTFKRGYAIEICIGMDLGLLIQI